MRSISAVFMLLAGSAFSQVQGELLISGGPALPFYSFGPDDPHTFGTSMNGHVGLNMDVGFLMPLAADTVKTGFRLFLGLGYVRHAFAVNYSSGGNGSGFEAFDTFSTSELQLRLMPRWTVDARQRLWIGIGAGMQIYLLSATKTGNRVGWVMNQGNTTTEYTDADAKEDMGSAFSMRAGVGYYLPLSKRMDLCGTAIIDHYFGLPLRALEKGGSWEPSLNLGVRYGFGR